VLLAGSAHYARRVAERPTFLGRGGPKRGTRAGNDSKWPEHALVLDTETRVTADLSLMFGLRASESTSPLPSLGSYLVVIIGTAKPDVV